MNLHYIHCLSEGFYPTKGYTINQTILSCFRTSTRITFFVHILEIIYQVFFAKRECKIVSSFYRYLERTKEL